MWPLVITFLRTYAPYVTLPFAGLVGFVGYNLENILSDKYTPYNKSIEELRNERLLQEDKLQSSEHASELRYEANVLGQNLSPSLSN
ncbi:hypothetical protein ABEB36_006182 [Hypothenemus hampei]|uniref:Small integral membrane protein 12 n=1 Tax=Hypothenemus hampei TaxID=57062 RepID=A0ABD1ETM4_HYPHA